MGTQIHPTAIVHAGAELSEGVIVGPYAIIEEDVIIGAGTRIDAHAKINRFVRLGANNHIYSYACVGGEPQDLKFAGEESWLEMGDNNRVREFSTLNRGTESGGGVTRIGNHGLFMSYCHVAHDCHVGDNVVFSNGATLAGHVHVGDSAILGGLAAVHQFCRVGEHAFLGAMSGISQDLPPFMLASASKGANSVVYGPNVVGLRRMGASQELLGALRQAYKIIWLQKIPRQEAMEQVHNEYGSLPEIAAIVEFLRTSERGIVPGPADEQEA